MTCDPPHVCDCTCRGCIVTCDEHNPTHRTSDPGEGVCDGCGDSYPECTR